MTEAAAAIDTADTQQALEGGEAEAPQLTEVEQIALEKGWKPKDAFKGDETQWRPAPDFLRKLRTDTDLKRELRGVREQLDRVAAASTRQTKRALDEQAAEIQGRFDAAIEAKDKAGAARAAKDMQELGEEAKAASAPSTGDVEKDFARDNPWYGKDEEATDYAISVSQREARKGKTVEEQLEAVTIAMKRRFPDLVGEQQQAPDRKAPVTVAAPSRAAQGKREKGYADLPPEAKRAADDYANLFKDRHGKDPAESKKAYARDYFAEVGE